VQEKRQKGFDLYYLLSSSSRPRRRIGKRPFIKGVSWWRGAVITAPVPEPLNFVLDPYSPGSPAEDQYMGAVIETNPPVWRDDFIQAIRDCGVNNFDLYEVAIADPDSGAIHTNYKAVNILGLVTAADMQKSVATVHDGIPLIDVDFDKLVVDEKKTKGIKLFRLAESSNATLVHESLRNALLERGFGTDVEFYDLEEAAI
jgi:hypothetical protein